MYTLTHTDQHGVTRKLLLTELNTKLVSCHSDQTAVIFISVREIHTDLDMPIEQADLEENPAAEKRNIGIL